jgi:hypothetical protein
MKLENGVYFLDSQKMAVEVDGNLKIIAVLTVPVDEFIGYLEKAWDSHYEKRVVKP